MKENLYKDKHNKPDYSYIWQYNNLINIESQKTDLSLEQDKVDKNILLSTIPQHTHNVCTKLD